MTRTGIELIGFAAGLFTTCAALPQIVHAWRTRSMRDVSMTMILAMLAGLALWLVYGLLLHSLPLIVWNAVTLSFYLAILTLKLRFDAELRVAAGGSRTGSNFLKDVER